MRYNWMARTRAHIARHQLVPAQVETALMDRFRTLKMVQVDGEERAVVHGACERSTVAGGCCGWSW
jgi:hypothetical protein